jgi:citrate synthase
MSEATYSPGLEGVIAGETAISSVVGGLQYRGYAIDDLAENVSYEEVAYLVLQGELPSRAQHDEFRAHLAQQREVPPALYEVIRYMPPDVPAMDALRTAVSMLAHFDPEVNDHSHASNVRKAERLIARIPTLIAARHWLKRGEKPPTPRRELGHAANLLYLLTGREPSADHAQAMDVSLVLYTEHEFNASTFAARVTASSKSDIYSAITSAVGTLKGPLHGGANEEAMKVLLEVGEPANAEPWLRKCLAEKRLVMGFGHRVYKVLDPRAEILKRLCRHLASGYGSDKWEQIADTIEHVVKTEKKLPANVDWPAARLYYYLGLEIELYTPLFVAARIAGWSAHVIEQLDNNRIFRPMGQYIGAASRKVVPLAKRA